MTFEKWLSSPVFAALSMLVAVVLMLHATLSSPFYAYDDDIHIRTSLTHEWSDLYAPSTSSMPLARLSYRVDYWLFHPSSQPAKLSDTVDIAGLNSWAPAVRCMSGLYHLLAALLLWVLLLRIGVPRGAAYLVAFLWAAHPCACESVCWVSERKTVLTALFGFAALLAWTLDKKYVWRLPLSYGLYLLAHLCKPSALGFLPLFGALELLDSDYQNLPWLSGKRWWTFARRLSGPVILCALAIFIGVHNQNREIVDPPGGNVFTALLTDTEIVARYFFNTFVPIKLSYFYGVRPITSLADPRLWIYGTLVLGFMALCIRFTEEKLRLLTIFGLVWFFGALGPNSNLIASPYWMQDRYIYLAIPGLLLAGTLALRSVLLRASPGARTVLPIGVAAALLMLCLLGYRATFFRDTDTLEIDASEKEPSSSFAQLCAAGIFSKLKQNAATADQKRMYAIAAAGKFAQALTCPDLVNFKDPFTVKLQGLDLLLEVGENDAVRRSLDGWLPPPHLKMLTVVRNEGGHDAAFARRSFLRGYFPATLAHAWNLMVETSLRDAITHPALEDRVALSDRALVEARKAVEIWNEAESQIVMAKALLYKAAIEGDLKHRAAAHQNFTQAQALLHAIPANSPQAPAAQYLLSHASEPVVNGPE
jgi:hypothetical protein